jgi:cohesin domain-containing protein/PEP-CTERM motif-containing protein
MKKLFSSAAFVLFMIVLLSPARSYADAVLSVQTPPTVPPGSTFVVGVNISNVTDLFSFQFDLGFNPAVLQATGIIMEGAFLPLGGATFFIPGAIDNTLGNVTFNADTLIGAGPGVSGSGTLVLFDFTALAPGTSALTISNVILQNSTLATLNSTTTAGSVTVPEPSSLMLLGAGLFGLLGLTRKKTTQ